MATKSTTVAAALVRVREMKQQGAVYSMLVNILRTRFLPRDGMLDPAAQISCEGAPVSVAVIEEIADNLEGMTSDLTKDVRKILSSEYELQE